MDLIKTVDTANKSATNWMDCISNVPQSKIWYQFSQQSEDRNKLEQPKQASAYQQIRADPHSTPFR